MAKITVPTFDQALDSHESGGDKAAKREESKLSKFNQLNTSKSNLEMKIMKQKSRLTKSYHDSSMDSVQIYMDLQVLEKELDATTELLTGLFPNGLN